MPSCQCCMKKAPSISPQWYHHGQRFRLVHDEGRGRRLRRIRRPARSGHLRAPHAADLERYRPRRRRAACASSSPGGRRGALACVPRPLLPCRHRRAHRKQSLEGIDSLCPCPDASGIPVATWRLAAPERGCSRCRSWPSVMRLAEEAPGIQKTLAEESRAKTGTWLVAADVRACCPSAFFREQIGWCNSRIVGVTSRALFRIPTGKSDPTAAKTPGSIHRPTALRILPRRRPQPGGDRPDRPVTWCAAESANSAPPQSTSSGSSDATARHRAFLALIVTASAKLPHDVLSALAV